MTQETEKSNPQERVSIPVTANATLEASRFCLERCGLEGEAQEMAVVAIALSTGEVAYGQFGEQETEIETEGQKPTIVMECKGPRKKYLVMGELVCRSKARVDALDA